MPATKRKAAPRSGSSYELRQAAAEKATIRANANRMGAKKIVFHQDGVVSVSFASRDAAQKFQTYLFRQYPDHTSGDTYSRNRVVGYVFAFHTKASMQGVGRAARRR